VLVIDQFEEVFTLVASEEEREHFLNLLYQAVTQPENRLKLIITLRADFYDKPLLYENFGSLVQTQTQVILPLKTEELQESITGPARRVGLEFDADLVAAIVSDVRQEPGALPLLQYALTELFEHRDGKRLHLDAYRRSGGVSGALARRAEEVYRELSDEQQEVAEQIFLRLVSPGEGTEDTRRRARYSELVTVQENRKRVQSVLDAFGKYRLLTFDHDVETREPTIEVAHEALIREWKRLKAWLNESRDDLRLQQMLINSMSEWRAAKRDDSYLLRGVRLAQFEEWRRTSDLALSQDEREFLDASIKEHRRQEAAERERQARELALERRSRRRLQLIAGILAVASVIGIFLTIQVYQQSQAAQRESENARRERDIAARNLVISESLRQSNIARQLLSAGDTVDALTQAIEAVEIENPPAESLETLLEIAYQPGLRQIVDQGESAVTAVAISGQYVLSGAGESDLNQRTRPGPPQGGPAGPGQPPPGPQEFSLVLWNVETGEQVRQLKVHNAAFSDVLFVDETTAVTASLDGLITVWDLSNGAVLHESRIPRFDKITLSLSGGNLLLISGGRGGQTAQGGLFLWDWETEGEPRPVPAELGELWTARISPDGKTAVLAYLNGALVGWDVQGEKERLQLRIDDGIKADNYEVTISPDNRMVAASFGSHSIWLWNLETGALINRVPGGTVITRRAFFSGDSSVMLIISQDGIVRLWDIQNGVELSVMQDRSVTFETGAVSQRFVVTASSDGSLRFWEIAETPLREIQRFDSHPIKLASFLPDGQHIVTAGPVVNRGVSSELVVWDMASGEALHVLRENPSFMPQTLEVSPDGQLAVLGMVTRAPGLPPDAGGNNQLIVWNLTTGEETRRIDLGGKFEVFDVAFNPSNKHEVLAVQDINIRLWNIETGEMLTEFKGHTRPVKGLAFLPDGTFVSVGDDAALRVWDVQTGHNLRTIELAARSGFLVLAPDGKTVAIANDQHEIILIDIETGAEIRRLTAHTDGVLSFAFSPDGKQALSGSFDNTFILWDVENGAIIRHYKEHNGAVWAVDFHPDGQHLLSVAEGAGMIAWRLWDGQPNPPLNEVMAWIEANRYVPQEDEE
jgi:WD40 repeat protein